MPSSKTVIVICGPTASGKTQFAVDLAKMLHTEIISSDSRQCYKELNIGVARPSQQQLSEVKHHFINSHSIFENVNAASFEKYALNELNEIFIEHDIAIMTGGTGLYVRSFLEGLDEIPETDAKTEEEIKTNFKSYGIDWLQSRLKELDPRYFAEGEIQNPHRLLRALAVKLTTGKSILDFHKKNIAVREFNVRKIWLEIPRKELYRRIDSRVDQMMDAGLLDEVKNLYQFKKLNSLQTVGYKELFDYLDGKTDLEKAISLIKQNTRHYAKRQITWFRKYFLHD